MHSTQQPAQLLDGQHCATWHMKQLKQHIKSHGHTATNPPGLAVIQVGSDPASSIYVRKKREACKAVGIQTFHHDLPVQTTQQHLLTLIKSLNEQPNIHGILMQLPLPQHIDKQAVIEAIDPKKDVDGIHPYTLGRLAQKCPIFQPCTPYGILLLLEYAKRPILGLNTVIVGASTIVGRPAALSFLSAGATVTLCHTETTHLSHHIQQAECLIVAIGNPNVIDAAWIKPGSIVIDVGINRTPEGRLIGDIPFEAARKRAGWITPVPGGVGPMTVTALLLNTWQAYQHLTH
jgi:methylenetetrahydrofolate dehydrogenase (NADP+) / methenyltetrahydrofolate cyclohydrolase